MGEAKGVGENSDLEALTFNEVIGELFKIEGYKALAILTSEGEVLFDTTTPQTNGNFGAWLEVFNALFDQTCNLGETSGFFGCQQVSMRTSTDIVIIRNAGQHCLIGLRLLVIFDHQGNQAMIHRKLDRLLPPLMRHLNRDPDTMRLLFPENLHNNVVHDN